MAAARALVGLLVLRAASCDEMAFVNVTANDMIYIRSLDITVKPMVGAQSLFSADPMAAHDWANPRTVASSLDAQVSAWERRDAAPAAAGIEALRRELEPLYAALPKNAHGRLDNGTARYGLHRHFARAYGWAVKGLEPAGASWVRTMAVGPEVRQVMKFIMPAYLQELVLHRAGDGKGVDLHWLTIMAATIRHIAHAELIEYLYSILRTLGYPMSGEKTEPEVEDIVLTFVMVYAFGTDLEASTQQDVWTSRRYLDSHHRGWLELRSHVLGLLAAAQPKPSDFQSILSFVEDFTTKYGDWQDRDCKLAAERFAALPEARTRGRVPLADLRPVSEPGHRALFSETQKELEPMGVLAKDADGRQELVVANYLLSQAMCLTTAGVHTVCCRSGCDALLERAELAAAAPEATPQAVLAALGVEGAAAEALETLAAEGGRGTVLLHSRGFSEWMHRAFPLVCPAPSDSERTNPKTPGEWMADPGSDPITTEELYYELSDAFARYTTLGATARDRAVAGHPVDVAGDTTGVEVSWPRRHAGAHAAVAALPARRRYPAAPLQIAAIASMVAAVLVVSRSMIGSVRRASGRCVGPKKSFVDVV